MNKHPLLASLLISFLLNSGMAQNKITGKWISKYPEKSATGSFGVRQFNIEKEVWEVQATVYMDSSLKFPLFTFRATGKYSIGEKSRTVNNAREAVFSFDKKYLTVKTDDTAIIRKFGFDKCNLTYLKEKDITETGCAYFSSKAFCAQEYDLISKSGDILYLGARPTSGGICEALKRPTALGLPLKKIVE